jgi:CheY-like chemotaxis protein
MRNEAMDEPMRILVVDDSATIRTALQLILAPTGYDVDYACTGAEAIDKAGHAPPAMILLDFILPDMRGTEVCRALLADARTRALPVVLVSARGAEIRQAYQDVDNVVAYLTKPFTPDQVHAVIEDVLALVEGGAPFATSSPPAAVSEAASAAAPPPEVAAPAAPAWAEAEDEIDDEIEAEPVAPAAVTAGRREALDAIFETLRAGLEGVHVEETDTTAGAAADQWRAYAELATPLARQLEETLAHATSGARYTLASDGSIRSLEDALLDSYRRVCRLIFRSVTAGVARAAADAPRPRVLVVGRADGEPAEAVATAADGADWHLFRITSGFCQLPVMARLYGPSHLVVDLSGPTVWSELAALRQMSESRRLRLIGVVDAGAAAPDQAQLASHGIGTLLVAGPRLAEEIHRWVSGEAAGDALAAPAEVHASAA